MEERDELFEPAPFEQIRGQLAMSTDPRLYFVTYELFDRNGYKLTNACNSFRACSAEAASALACQSAAERGLTAEVILVSQ